MNVGFAGPVIPAFDGIIEQAIDGVPVVLVVFGCIDTTLSGNAMGPTR